ncbi:MAG: hypothetical protein H0W97_11630 [Actinobacteria bacterium]|nr:hypothetical protein [Actinomycetota bacterium]
MDDSFAFKTKTTVPLRSRLDPGVAKAAVFGTVLVLAVGLFARWVVVSERGSFSRAVRREEPPPAEAAAGPVDDLTSVSRDMDAEEAIGVALAAAEVTLSKQGSFLDATPARLTSLQPGYIYVDGPSTAPEIVSVAARADVWAAAVRGFSGTCFWVRAATSGDVTRGIGSDCTGAAALSPPSPR